MIENWRQSSTGERVNFTIFIAFLGMVLMFGGASRADVLGQGLVRIAAIFMIAASILQMGREGWHAVRVPALFLLTLLLVIVLQLVPLPPGIWQALPGRELYVEALASAGVVPAWRPLSLTPDLTLNSLLAVLPPLAAIMGMGLISQKWHQAVLTIILIGIGASAFVGILQISAGSPYFYRVTNLGSAVGMFANRNHAALFIAIAFPMLAGWAYSSLRDRQTAAVRLWIALCCAAAIFPLLLVTGSRGGLLIGMVGAGFGGAVAVSAQRAIRGGAKRGINRKRLLLFGVPLLLGIAAVMLFVYLARDEALRRMFQNDNGTVRDEFLPLYLRMIGDFFPAGSGFGSFDPVFRAYEPLWALNNFYLNHAHNDPAEFLIEGGLPALALLAIFLAWWLFRSVRLWGKRGGGRQQLLGRVGSSVIAMTLLGSLVDYPLRTPLVAVVMAIACCWICEPEGKRERLR